MQNCCKKSWNTAACKTLFSGIWQRKCWESLLHLKSNMMSMTGHQLDLAIIHTVVQSPASFSSLPRAAKMVPHVTVAICALGLLQTIPRLSPRRRNMVVRDCGREKRIVEARYQMVELNEESSVKGWLQHPQRGLTPVMQRIHQIARLLASISE